MIQTATRRTEEATMTGTDRPVAGITLVGEVIELDGPTGAASDTSRLSVRWLGVTLDHPDAPHTLGSYPPPAAPTGLRTALLNLRRLWSGPPGRHRTHPADRP